MTRRVRTGDSVELTVNSLGFDGLGRGELTPEQHPLTAAQAAKAGAKADTARAEAAQAGATEAQSTALPEYLVGDGLPGERGQALVVHAGKQRVLLRLFDLRGAESELRRKPECPRWTPASPCRLMHVSQATQLALKRDQVKAALASAGVAAEVKPTIGQDSQLGWRSRVTYLLRLDRDRAVLAAFRRGSHSTQHMTECGLPEPALQQAAHKLEGVLQGFRHLLPRGKLAADAGCGEPQELGQLRGTLGKPPPREAPSGEHAPKLLHHLSLRSNAQGEVMACFLGSLPLDSLRELAADALDGAGLHSVYAGPSGHGDAIFGLAAPSLLAGQPEFIEQVDGLDFELLPRTFFQVHRSASARLQRDAAALAVGDRVLDVFSGVGALALRSARLGKAVTAVESVPEAAELGRKNAARNQLEVSFHHAEAASWLPGASDPYSTVFVNPPRKGLGGTSAEIARLTGQRLIYISCSPVSLARDLAELTRLGLRLSFVQPYDLFPASEHVESVALLERDV